MATYATHSAWLKSDTGVAMLSLDKALRMLKREFEPAEVLEILEKLQAAT